MLALGVTNITHPQDSYPIEFAIGSSTLRKNHNFVRLFLKYNADVAIEMSRHGFRVSSFAMLPFRWDRAKTQETSKL